MTGGYDRALTVFSPDGHLLQVEYANEAVSKGMCVVGIKASNAVVLAVEYRPLSKLDDARTSRKICRINDSIVVAFSGLQADARVLIDNARVEAQNHVLHYSVDPSVDYIARYIAEYQQRYTSQGGTRPFGVSLLVAGFSNDGKPGLLRTEPHGILTSWKALSIGRHSKTIQDFLEENIDDSPLSESSALNLSVKALLEIVETAQKGVQNMDITVVTESGIRNLTADEIENLVSTIVNDKKDDEDQPMVQK